MKIIYINRIFKGAFECVDTIKELTAIDTFTSGGLLYAKINPFEYKTIDIGMIVEFDGKQGEYIKRHNNIVKHENKYYFV